jgi:hypothetical protein
MTERESRSIIPSIIYHRHHRAMQRCVYSNKEHLDSPCVLFQDYNGFWAPLNDLYFSTSSNVLVSRHPESAIEEVVSHYCPQCLNKYSEEDVNTYANRCSTCLQCPCCDSLLTGSQVTDQTAKQCCLVCSSCSWDSTACGIIGESEQQLAALVLTQEKDNKASGAFSTLLAALTMSATQTPSANTPFSAPIPPHQTWGMQALDELQQQKALKDQCCNPQEESSLYTYLKTNNVMPQEAQKRAHDMKAIISCTDASALSTSLQRCQGEYTSSSGSRGGIASSLLPQRMFLRTKRMLRSRGDVKAGKMSILVQPKTFPLEGDSSHKLHQGKWFLKDASGE